MAPRSSYTYHPIFNKPLTVTDPRGLVTTLSYDGDTGSLLTVVSDSGTSPHFNAKTTIAYNGLGLPVSVRNPVNIVTAFEYDTRGNRTAIVADAANLRRRTAFAYDSVGNAISMTDPRGGITTNGWDAGRQLVTTTSPATLAAPSGLVTTNTYDANGQVLQRRQSANATVLATASATYTLSGKTATATDARGNVTRYAYDSLDRLVSVTDPMSRRTQFTYTALSHPYRTYAPAIQAAPLLEQAWTADGLGASLKDANGNTTGFAYDRFDRLITTTYPGGSTESATWDANANMLTRTTRAGATLRYGYDTLNRLVTKTAAATPVACSAATSATPTVTYRYDLASRVTGVCDNGAVIAAITPPPSAIARR
jgi:YD repeat-containing protein